MSGRDDEPGLSPGKKRPWLLPLNNPPVAPASLATAMRPDDLVVGVAYAGRTRAYPFWIVANYHVVNDSFVLSDEPAGHLIAADDNLTGKPLYPWFPTAPLLVTLCEACAGASAFVPVFDEAPNNPLVFSIVEGSAGASSGPAPPSGTFTICDLQTRSRWHPLAGRAWSGPLAHHSLRRVPAVLDRWDRWLGDHPETEVLFAGDEMRRRPHALDHMPSVADPEGAHTSVVVRRKRSPETIDRRLGPGEMVLGVAVSREDRSSAIAHPLALLRERGGCVQVEVGGEPCLLLHARDFRAIALSRTLGDETLDFRIRSQTPFRVCDASGSEWNDFGEAVGGRYSGRRLTVLLESYVSKWSEWSASHPHTEIAR